jgi:hypothetical protein
MHEGRSRVAQGVTRSEQTRQSLLAIVESVEGTAACIDAIAEAVKRNNHIGAEIRGRVQSIEVAAQELGTTARDSAQITAELNTQSGRLSGLVEEFLTDRRAGQTPRSVLDRPTPCGIGDLVDVSGTGAQVRLAPGAAVSNGQVVSIRVPGAGERPARVVRLAECDGQRFAGLQFEG